MEENIFELFLDNNFKKTNEKENKGITLLFGSPGSGKTEYLKKEIKKENNNLLYIGRNFEKNFFKDLSEMKNKKSNNKKRMILSTNEDENFKNKKDIMNFEENINKLLNSNYIIYFDEVFWNNALYYEMIERIIITNKFKGNIFIVMNNINKDFFGYERITKNIENIILFKNDLVSTKIPLYSYKKYKRIEKKHLTKEEIKEFHKN